MSKSVILFFGSFNPIHLGHLIIAAHILEFNKFDELWFVLSPQNPFKESNDLAPFDKRKKMLEIAIRNEKKMKICDIESKLTLPSYTINTLFHLKNNFPEINFSILMGEDNLQTLHLWKDYKNIIQNFKLVVYPRNVDANINIRKYKNVEISTAPNINISSSTIRNRITNNLSIDMLVDVEVAKFIKTENLYKP